MMHDLWGDLVIHDVQSPAKIQKKLLHILRDKGITAANFPLNNKETSEDAQTKLNKLVPNDLKSGFDRNPIYLLKAQPYRGFLMRQREHSEEVPGSARKVHLSSQHSSTKCLISPLFITAFISFFIYCTLGLINLVHSGFYTWSPRLYRFRWLKRPAFCSV